MTLTLNDLQALIERGENQNVEFKSEVTDDVVRGLSTDIAAFANGEGGRIIFGVEDKKEPSGCVLTGSEKKRISQEASKCRPPVSIELEQIPFGSKTFLVVNVPRTGVVHSDDRDRFPVRVGEITSFMDGVLIVYRLSEKGFLSGRAGPQLTLAGTDTMREPLPQSESAVFARALTSSELTTRLEALRDVGLVVHRSSVLEDRKIQDALGDMVEKGTESFEEQKLVLDIIRGVLVSGTETEKQVVKRWMNTLVKIAISSESAEVARSAFDVLEVARNKSAVDVLVRWITEADDPKYAALAPRNLIQNVRYYGLYGPIREAMYAILEKPPSEEVKKRVSAILEAARRST